MREGKFDMKDFSDYGHMDASGGKKVLDIIARDLTSSAQTRARLAPQGDLNAVQ